MQDNVNSLGVTSCIFPEIRTHYANKFLLEWSKYKRYPSSQDKMRVPDQRNPKLKQVVTQRPNLRQCQVSIIPSYPLVSIANSTESRLKENFHEQEEELVAHKITQQARKPKNSILDFFILKNCRFHDYEYRPRPKHVPKPPRNH